MSTAIDYIGRSFDFLAFQVILPAYRGRENLLIQELTTSDGMGAIIAGVQKAVQRFLIVFLTKKGSVVSAPDEGTTFMIEAQQGLWRTVADVEQAFYSARLDAVRQITSIETDADPLDERFGDVVLNGVTLNGDSVSISITYTTLDGFSYTYLTPLEVPIR